MTKDRGRGVFATDNIYEGEYVIIEKPIAHIIRNLSEDATDE